VKQQRIEAKKYGRKWKRGELDILEESITKVNIHQEDATKL